ncbi:response regulator [Haloplanus natans]|uniref:response regulator n=1 Tax=Haloplanus natans TaxID=376171 RepID=UPI000678307F|nr:response regulator [Haloplanus natans]
MSYSLTNGEQPDATAEPIHVLLVDDDAQWAKLLATDIEREADSIDVTVTTTARECLETFQDRDDIDCLISDYQMPGQTGIDLLEQIREHHPQLPFLLVTSQGSETVAARAIEAGVSDYLVKEFGDEQVTKFVDKIRRAVTHYRLQDALEESEQRYRTVTEQSRDAIAILRYEQLLFCNERLVELTGQDHEDLTDESIVETSIYAADRTQVRDVLDSWYATDEQSQLHETRIERPDGTIRHCEYTGRQLDYQGEPATLVSIRDVTERKQRERELQWERDLNRTIQETLVESRTRERLEQDVTDQLQRHGYALAWVAERDSDVVVPRTVGGDRRYIEAIDRGIEDCGMNSEPAVWAIKTGETRFLQNFDDRPATDWAEIASGYNYRSGAALPLVYDNISYGVLAVYHDQSGRFDATEQRLLEELADTIAFAIHSQETQGALASDQTVEVTIQLQMGYYLIDLARDGVFDAEARVSGTVLVDENTVIQYLEVDGDPEDGIQDALATHPDIQDVSPISEEPQDRLEVTVSGQPPEARLASQGVVVNTTSVKTNGATITFELQNKNDVRSTVQPLEDRFGTVTVQSIIEREQQADNSRRQVGTNTLTEKQLAALKAAYYHDYFNQPRGSSATAIAESLDISHSTFLRHLRAAQGKLFSAKFG